MMIKKMNSHKCDMCGLYLVSDSEACQECVNKSKINNKVAARSQLGVEYGRDEIECNHGENGDKCEF
jgi:hypothetical protein